MIMSTHKQGSKPFQILKVTVSGLKGVSIFFGFGFGFKKGFQIGIKIQERFLKIFIVFRAESKSLKYVRFV